MKAETYRIVASETVFRGHIFSVASDRVLFSDGVERDREVVMHPGAAGAVALTPEGEVILVRQYRHAVKEILLEIPAGLLAPGEEPADCIRRELREEVGVEARELIPLAAFYTTPGCSNERFHLYLTEGVSPGEPSPEDDEELEPAVMPFKEALNMVAAGEITDAKTIIGLLLAEKHLHLGSGL